MEQYLRMADVFRDVAQPERFNYAMANPKATYAAHAINSHDELVQMNHELLAALEIIAASEEFHGSSSKIGWRQTGISSWLKVSRMRVGG